ncbi:hypothetical protein ACM3N2_17940 [Aeromonas hydrophila]|uniref:hypothetical protein n=1 Tax=Aeromonas hydrophila TaxID=644 RepID=UPI0039F6578C
MNKFLLLSVVACSVMLAGCITAGRDNAKYKSASTEMDMQLGRGNPKKPEILIEESRYVDSRPQVRDRGVEWLKNKRVNIQKKNGSSLSLGSIVSQFAEAGINISSSLPLQTYTYNGFSIKNTDALTALEVIAGTTGLDFVVEKRPGSREWYVSIIPMGVSEYALNFTNRDISLNVIGQSLDKSSLGKMEAESDSGSDSGKTAGQADTSSIKYSTPSFFDELSKELESRLQRQLPYSGGAIVGAPVDLAGMGGGIPSLPDLPVPGNVSVGGAVPSVGAGSANSGYQSVSVGNYTVNKATGRVTVHAPRHVRKAIMSYLRDIDMEMSANIELTGKIFVLNESSSESQGIDISAFIKFANNEFGVAVSNSVINGLNVMTLEDGSVKVGSDDAMAGSLVGMVNKSSDRLIQVFNAYLESQANTVTILEPHANTTSGVPASISQRRPLTFSRYEATASGGENSNVATSNKFFTIEFGTSLNILPKYDAKKDVVRAQIDLTQVVQGGTQEIQQVVTTSKDIETKTTKLPIPDIYSIQTEAIIRNGALVLMGGQSLASDDNSVGGITGLVDSPLGGLFGKGAKNNNSRRFYMVLSARAVPYSPYNTLNGVM